MTISPFNPIQSSGSWDSSTVAYLNPFDSGNKGSVPTPFQSFFAMQVKNVFRCAERKIDPILLCDNIIRRCVPVDIDAKKKFLVEYGPE